MKWRRFRTAFVSGAMLMATAHWPSPWGVARAETQSPRETSAARARVVRADLPLAFESNEGQTASQVKFLSREQSYTIFLTGDGAVLALKNKGQVTGNRLQGAGRIAESRTDRILRMRLVGANTGGHVFGGAELPGKCNYFVGNDPTKWLTNVATYAKVTYEGVYPGVDLVYYGNQGQLEYDFVVAPGADPRAIQLDVGAASEPPRAHRDAPLHIALNGDLVVKTDGGEVRFRKPLVYQRDSAGGRQYVAARYVLGAGQTSIGNHQPSITFALAAYDRRRPLVIDPVLVYSTYLGGAGNDQVTGVAVDSAGFAYTVGTTQSVNFPVTSRPVPLQSKLQGSSNLFITKLDTTGSTRVYSTYLGGNGSDQGSAIAVDSLGSAFVTGTTTSANFPTTSGVFQTKYGGAGDAFVSKLSVNGATLAYSTYLGGNGTDFAHGIAIDNAGDAYVAGSTESTNFPAQGAFQTALPGITSAFVSKLNSTGTALVYSTYLGGSATDSAQAIAIDGSGAAYVAGFTLSGNFPVLNAIQRVPGGNGDAFVAKLTPAGSSLVYSTYLGGAALDRAYGVAADASGNAYVTGDTSSADFPVTPGAFQPLNSGNDDVFVAKVNAAGSALAYSTFLGGTATDVGYSVAIDGSGNATVTGLTESEDFPTLEPFQPSIGGDSCGAGVCPDGFVTRLGPSGNPLLFSSYLGGSGADFGQAVTLDLAGDAYVGGVTSSSNFPAVAGAFQGDLLAAGSLSEGFVVKVSSSNSPALTATPQNFNFGSQGIGVVSSPVAVTLGNAGTAPLIIDSFIPSAGYVVVASGTTCERGMVLQTGAVCTLNVGFKPTAAGPEDGTVTFTDNTARSPQIIAFEGQGVTAGPAVTLSQTSLAFPTTLTVGQKSAPQSVTVTNSGSAILSFKTIVASTGYAESNNCGASLNPGASCVIKAFFTPITTGSSSGSLTITDNSPTSPQRITFAGAALAVFSVRAVPPSTPVVVGAASTTYTVSASAPKGFTTAITLACGSAPGATCAFNPATITPGHTSVLTITGLSSSTTNPYAFTVTGTINSTLSTQQVAMANVTLNFADVSLAQSPSLESIVAGGKATYELSVTPLNGFKQAVTLACVTLGLPTGLTCSVSPSSVTPIGSGVSNATVTVSTEPQSTRVIPRYGPAGRPNLPSAVIWLIFGSLGLLFWGRALGRGLPGMARGVRAVALGLALVIVALGLSCQQYGYNVIGTGGLKGTPSGTYVITISGTIGTTSSTSTSTSTSIVRETSANLTVQSNLNSAP